MNEQTIIELYETWLEDMKKWKYYNLVSNISLDKTTGVVSYSFDSESHSGYMVEVDLRTEESRTCGFGQGCFWTEWK